MERHDKVEKKGPSIPTYVFLPFLVFAKVDEGSAVCGNRVVKRNSSQNFTTVPPTNRTAGGGEDVNFNHPSPRWRHTPRLGKGKKKKSMLTAENEKKCQVGTNAWPIAS